eukprot:11031047-Ditylum_brightwellii.AAC.1
MATITTYTTRLAARKAATTLLEEVQEEAAIQEHYLPENVGHAPEQLEVDDQHDLPVDMTLPCQFLPGETEEVDPPLPLQGGTLDSCIAGSSQQDSQDHYLEPDSKLPTRGVK